MILGYQFTFLHVIYLGIIAMTLLVFQMLVGTRTIKFKGRTHQKVHRWTAWVMFGVGVVHGLLAAAVYFGWSILS